MVSRASEARLWQMSLADRLTEDYYDARLAGLSANCACTVAGISVSFSGYNDKLLLFSQEVMKKIRDFDGPNEQEFARALDALQREQVPTMRPLDALGDQKALNLVVNEHLKLPI